MTNFHPYPRSTKIVPKNTHPPPYAARRFFSQFLIAAHGMISPLTSFPPHPENPFFPFPPRPEVKFKQPSQIFTSPGPPPPPPTPRTLPFFFLAFSLFFVLSLANYFVYVVPPFFSPPPFSLLCSVFLFTMDESVLFRNRRDRTFLIYAHSKPASDDPFFS